MESIENLIKQYTLLTDWFLSALENINDQDGGKTINDNSNSLEWIAGHLITGRYRNIVRLRVQPEPYKYMSKFIDQSIPPPNGIKFDKRNTYPSLTDSRREWAYYGKIFLDSLNTLTTDILKDEIPFNVLSGGNKVEDALTFMVMHETYHIGQMSIIRKALGYSAMQLTKRNQFPMHS